MVKILSFLLVYFLATSDGLLGIKRFINRGEAKGNIIAGGNRNDDPPETTQNGFLDCIRRILEGIITRVSAAFFTRNMSGW